MGVQYSIFPSKITTTGSLDKKLCLNGVPVQDGNEWLDFSDLSRYIWPKLNELVIYGPNEEMVLVYLLQLKKKLRLPMRLSKVDTIISPYLFETDFK